MKNIKLYELEETYRNEESSLEYPTVSYTKDTSKVWYMEKQEQMILNLMDIVYWDGTKIASIEGSSWDASLGEPIGICVIPSNTFDNGKARIISLYMADGNGNPTLDASLGLGGGQIYAIGSTNVEDFSNISSYTNGLINTLGHKENTDKNVTPRITVKVEHVLNFNLGHSNLQWYVPANNECTAITPNYTVLQATYQACMGIDIPYTNYFVTSTIDASTHGYSYQIGGNVVNRRLPYVGLLVPFAQI